MAIELNKTFAGVSDYVSRHVDNYTILENAVNSLEASVGAATGALAVPQGLQEIFDRDGVIGIDSYQLTPQTVVANNLTIPAGAAWMGGSFRKKADSTLLSTSGLTTGTRYLNVGSSGIPTLAASQSSDSIYSFSWDSGTGVISDVTLLVEILFSGSDYHDMLGTEQRVADRLDLIESQITALGGMYAQNLSTTSGLDFGYFGGLTRDDHVVSTTPDDTITLADDETNYIELNAGDGAVSSNTSGFTAGRIPLFIVTTVSGSIDTVTDQRTWAFAGGAGGHAQNTDVGTDSTTFTLNRLHTGAPTDNVAILVERGTSPTVGIRWNEDVKEWQQTNDGSIWTPLGAPDIGQQELSKFVSLENPPAVVDESGLSTSADYIPVNLTGTAPFSSIPVGVQGMVLRVQVTDSAPDNDTNALFRKIGNPAHSPTEALRVFARETGTDAANEGHVIVVQGEGLDMNGDRQLGFEYFVNASGAGTANLKVFVLGYWERVTGAGTYELNFAADGISVPANSTQDSNLPGFLNRGMTYRIDIEEVTGNPTGLYDVKIYTKDTFQEADLVYFVQDIDPATPFVDYRAISLRDDDGEAELHLRITNQDPSVAAEFDIAIKAERFA